MKARCRYRLSLFFCILLVGEEFARARTVYKQLNNLKLSYEQDYDNVFDDEFEIEVRDGGDDNPDDNDDDDGSGSVSFESHPKRMNLVHQKPVDECAGKKGWVTALFKGVKIGAKIANYASVAVTLAANIYSAVRDCKDIEPDAEKFHDMYKEKYGEAKELGAQADDLQFKSELDQTFIEGTVDLFRRILCKLNEIDRDSDTMLLSISPQVLNASNYANDAIKRLVDEKENKLDVTYVEIDNLYRSKLEHVLGIVVPSLLLAVPLGYSLFKTARKRYRQRKIGVAETTNGLDLKLPSKSSGLFKKTRFGRWIGRVQAKFGAKISSLKTKFNKYFGKIGKIASRFTKLLGSALSVAGSAYFAYESINSMIGECKKIRETAESAYNQAKKAVDDITKTLSDINLHREEMGKAWRYMRGNLTDEDFLESVKETKITMENAANQSEPMKAVSRGIGHFLDVIKTSDDHNMTYNASKDLYEVLIKVPFAYVCYTSKINIMSNVVSSCKDGASTLDDIITEVRDRFDESTSDPSSPTRCKDDYGIDYLPIENIKKSWLGTAKQNGYHPMCYMNSESKREAICNEYKSLRKPSSSEIAGKFDLNADKVQEIIDLLPDGPSSQQQQMICNLKKRFDDDKLRETLKKGGMDFTLEQIKAVTCNEENKYYCVPFEETVQNAWEKTTIKLPKFPEED